MAGDGVAMLRSVVRGGYACDGPAGSACGFTSFPGDLMHKSAFPLADAKRAFSAEAFVEDGRETRDADGFVSVPADDVIGSRFVKGRDGLVRNHRGLSRFVACQPRMFVPSFSLLRPTQQRAVAAGAPSLGGRASRAAIGGSH